METGACFFVIYAVDTGRGKLSPGEASLTKGKKTKDGSIDALTYRVCFILDPEFGTPGAIVVKNGDRNEFFLRYVTLELSETRSIHFDCNSWVYPYKKTNTDRVFFFNAVTSGPFSAFILVWLF